MRVLAIDPGSSCGFAVGGQEGAVASGVWQLAPARGESPGMRYVRLRGHLEVEHVTVHSATLKKWATGKGNAKKAAMLQAGRGRFSPTTDTDTDDEVDALWLLDYAARQWGAVLAEGHAGGAA